MGHGEWVSNEAILGIGIEFSKGPKARTTLEQLVVLVAARGPNVGSRRLAAPSPLSMSRGRGQIPASIRLLLPTLTLDGVPVGSAKLRPVMKDLDVPSSVHSGGSVAHDGQPRIPRGRLLPPRTLSVSRSASRRGARQIEPSTERSDPWRTLYSSSATVASPATGIVFYLPGVIVILPRRCARKTAPAARHRLTEMCGATQHREP